MRYSNQNQTKIYLIMWLFVNGKKSTELDDNTVKAILNLYPEEKLLERRKAFQEAFSKGKIDFKVLKDESDKCLLPWQLFFLEYKNLKKELAHIEKNRKDKVSKKVLSKRKGQGEISSKRILDRLIRLQNYICDNYNPPINKFCNSLLNLNEQQAMSHITDYFDIDLETFRSRKNKSSALTYLINKIEEHNINVCQGVLTNRILPHHQIVDNSVYKNTSGLVIKDDCIPFIFLPSETNPDETDGRQIFTLLYLLVLIGFGEYDRILEKDFTSKKISTKGMIAKIYRITSKLLLPEYVTEELRGVQITVELRDRLAQIYKITPTAVLFILRMRTIINYDEYLLLLPEKFQPKPKGENHMRPPHIDTSVKKFCGKLSVDFINNAIQTNTLKSTQAQYLLFGFINKLAYKKYRQLAKI